MGLTHRVDAEIVVLPSRAPRSACRFTCISASHRFVYLVNEEDPGTPARLATSPTTSCRSDWDFEHSGFVYAGCRVVASSGLAIADVLVIMSFTAKRCWTCGLLKFGRQGPGEDACRCCACVSTTCSHPPGKCGQHIKTYGAHRCPSCLKVYGIKRREQLRGNLSAISNIDGQLHPVLLNTNDVDDRDTAPCMADPNTTTCPFGAFLTWCVLWDGNMWVWEPYAMSWQPLPLPCKRCDHPATGAALPYEVYDQRSP